MSEQGTTKDLSSWSEVEASTGWKPGVRSSIEISAEHGWKALKEMKPIEIYRRIGEEALMRLQELYDK